jgi:hypothetical protein
MSALDRTPENTNYLQPTKFLLTFDRIPNAQYFCQSVNLPGLTLGTTSIETPFRGIPVAGTKLDYNPLNVTFNVNGDLKSWLDLHQWMRSVGSPTGFTERIQQSPRQNAQSVDMDGYPKSYSDATLTILSNLNNPIARIVFINAFPSHLSDLDFDTTKSADEVMTATGTFQFSYYDYVPLV